MGRRLILGSRYRYDGESILELNELQEAIKSQIETKIANGEYVFQTVQCPVCGGVVFEPIAEKDRYGLYMPVVICTRCGLIQTNPRMTQDSYVLFYDSEYRKLYSGQSSEKQAEILFRNELTKGRRIIELLRNTLGLLQKPLSDHFVVEIGAGSGGALEAFKEEGCRVLGVDLGEAYLSFGRSQYQLDLRVGTIADLSFDDRRPDIILYIHVLEHILDIDNELSLVHEILADNGFVYIELPGVKNLLNSYNMDLLRYLQNAHTFHFSLTTLRNALAKHGFKMIAGDEFIKSIFRKSAKSNQVTLTNDYIRAKLYLVFVEMLRIIMPVSLSRLRKSVRRRLRKIVF